MKTSLIIFTASLSTFSIEAASLLVRWSVTTDDVRRLVDNTLTPLSAGTSASGDGSLLELGYYSLASTSDPFSGDWIVLGTSSIGDDNQNVPGSFSAETMLGMTSDPSLTTSVPLSIRFHDGTSVENSNFYSAASNTTGSWNYITPSDPTPVLDLVIDKTTDVVFEADAFRTVIPIPEPSCVMITALGTLLTLTRRNRRVSLGLKKFL